MADTQLELEQDLVRRVVRSFDGCRDPRLKQIMVALVRHLHSLIREVRPTEAEWRAGIDFLTRCGEGTDHRRREFLLLSDVLGASTQTVAVNNEVCGDATEATEFGRSSLATHPEIDLGGDLADGPPGEPCWMEGSVTDTEGTPLPGAVLEVRQAGDDEHRAQRCIADEDGNFRCWAVTPTPYPIRTDGPVGQLLTAVGRSPMRAAHLRLLVRQPGFRQLVTHIFVEGDGLLDADSVFGVKRSLVRAFQRQPAGTPAPDGRYLTGRTWSRVRFDVVLLRTSTLANL